MDVYNILIEKSTQDELAEIIKNMLVETEKYKTAFYAAKAFIDSHVGNPDQTPDMCKKYDLYHVAIRGCQ